MAEKLKEKKKRYAISCTEVPEALLQKTNALNYFNQFGRIVKITFRLKSKGCIVDYDCEDAVFDAIDNGGCYDQNYFTIRPYFYKKVKKLSESKDPDWPEDPELKAELDALSEIVPHQHVFRSPSPPTAKEKMKEKPKKEKLIKPKIVKPKTVDTKVKKPIIRKTVKKSVKMEIKKKPIDPVELERLIGIIKQVAHTAEDKYKILDARDKLIRLHSSRQTDIGDAEKVIGTCPDMCPEKERYLRESQHQVSQYEQCDNDEHGDYKINHKTAIKQYSRSSADQEMPLPHELRPVTVLQYTMNYLLRNIIDLCDASDINIADWYHFVWDRTRSIRKDITQQQLCCRGSVELVEQCARFHIHCAARLVSEDVSVFDPKINTENLTKCLQTLKYMYHDLALQNIYCPNEAEFRGYIILLNLHDGNFMWEVKQLRREIQKSAEVNFAIKIFLALDNNNFVSFFKLVRQTTYLNACILLRYFNEVRSRTLNRMIRTHSPRATLTQIPLGELEYLLAFENRTALITFIDYHGLNLNEMGTHVILDRSSFTTSNSFELERAVNIVESKRQNSVGEIVCGGQIVSMQEFCNHTPHNSFDERGYFKKSEIQEQWINQKKTIDTTTSSDNVFGKKSTNIFEKSSESANVFNKPSTNIFEKPVDIKTSSIFKKPTEVKTSSSIFEKQAETKLSSGSIFEKPVEMKTSSIFEKPTEVRTSSSSIFEKPNETKTSSGSIFEKPIEVATDSSNIFKKPLEVKSSSNIFKKPAEPKTLSSNIFVKSSEVKTSRNIFEKPNQSNIFNKDVQTSTSIFNKPTENKISLFEKPVENKINFFEKPPESTTNIFQNEVKKTGSIFENKTVDSSNFIFKKPIEISTPNIFTPLKPENESNITFTKPSDVSFKPAETSPMFGVLDNRNELNVSKDCVDRAAISLKRTSDIYEFDMKTEAKSIKFQPYSKNKNFSGIKSNTFENKPLFSYPPSQVDLEYEEKRKIEEEKKREALKKAAEEEVKRKKAEEEKLKRMQLEAIKKAEEEERKRKIELERAKAEKELREKLLQQMQLKREQKEREQIVESLLDELINAIEIHETQQRLKQIGNNIKLWKIQYIVKKWRNRVSNIRKKRKAVEDSPVWVAKRSYIDEANELYTANQNLTLANMKQYKYKNQNKFKKKDEPIVQINFSRKIFQHLKESVQKFENTLTILKQQSIVIILRNGLNSQSKNKIIEILELEQLIMKNELKNYQIYIDDNYSLQEFINSIEMGLCYLANNIEQEPPLLMDQLSNFLHNTIGNEFAQRLKDSSKTNIALQLSFNDYKNKESLLACEEQAFEVTSTVDEEDDFDIDEKLSEITAYDYDREIHLSKQKEEITEFKSLLEDLNNNFY
ncbi:uncharacterized protein LOC123292639 [Chrysoperla carnea]|uniref:uncharacterized protein LOC123292639 n=1 Tax=Chrysoperla carnea TaxID=189513 RepID=UPI001D099CF1|nr:uncharacterized protein LOC123292639 [Chrysoperla carnea]